MVCNHLLPYKERQECMVPSKVLLRLANFLCGHECPCENWSAAPGCGALLLLRASPRSRKRQTTAPTPARLFLPRAAPRLRCQRRLSVLSTGCDHYVCIVPCRRHKRRERAEAQRPRGTAGDPETVWYPVKFFAKLFFKKAGKAGAEGGKVWYTDTKTASEIKRCSYENSSPRFHSCRQIPCR